MPRVLLLLASLLLGSAHAAVIDGTPVSAPEDAPAARGRTQPRIAFSGDRYLAVWLDTRDCDIYPGSLYAARFDRDGNILDPKGIVLVPCGRVTGYGTPQVFADADGWTATVPQADALAFLQVSSAGTIGSVRTVPVPVLFDPIVVRSSQGWLIHNEFGDKPALIVDPNLRPLASFAIERFGYAIDDATNGNDYISVRSVVDRATLIRSIHADLIGGDGVMKKRDAVLHTFGPALAPVSLSVVWTGSEYLVSWIEETLPPQSGPRRVVAIRINSNGDVIEPPRTLVAGLAKDATSLDTLSLRRELTLLSWTTDTSAFATIAGCDAAPVATPRYSSFATDGVSLLRVRQDARQSRTDLYSSIAPIGCGVLQTSAEQLVSGATIAQELPSVAGDAIAWVDVQTNALRGVRVDANGAIAGELHFPPHVAPREVRLAAHDGVRFAAWDDGGLLKAGLVLDVSSLTPSISYDIARISSYLPQFEVTWSGSEFLVIYVGNGALRVVRFAPDGTPISPELARHRVARFAGNAGELVAPTVGFFGAAYSAPKIAWSGGGEGMLVVQAGAPCGIIPECFSPRPYMLRIDQHGHALGAPQPLASYGAKPDVVWTGTEYLAAWSAGTVAARRFARDGQPLDPGVVDTGIVSIDALSLTMLGTRPFLVIAQTELIEGFILDSMLQPQRIAIADASGSSRTYADADSRNGDVLVAFHRTIPGEIYGGSTRVFYKLVPRR